MCAPILPALWGFYYLAIAIIFVFLVIYNFYQKQFKHWEIYKIKHTQPKFPFGDFGFQVLTEPLGITIDRIYRSFPEEKIAGLWTTFQPILIARDPDVIKDIMVKEFMSFHDRGLYVNEKDDPLGRDLFAISGSKWKNLRAKVNPAFSSGKIKMMFPTFIKVSNDLINVLEGHASNKEIVDMKEMLARYTTDVICSCAFGIDANSLKNSDAIFRKMGRKAVEPSLMQALGAYLFFIPKLAKLLRARATLKDIEEFFVNAIKEIVHHREKYGNQGKDLIQVLIDLKNKGKIIDDLEEDGNFRSSRDEAGQTFTFHDVAAQAFLFFLTGFESASSTMQFALYEMAKNPLMQEKLRTEIKNILAQYKGEITYEAVFSMNYLGRFLEETMRKYPVTPILVRQCHKDYKVPDSDIIIPSGTKVQIPVYSLHHDPKYYPDPERFDPDRFTEEEKAKRHSYTYLPFGDGPRGCIGRRFGMMQTRLGLIRLLTNYKFDLCEKSPWPLMVFATQTRHLTSKDGMPLRISKLE